MFWEASGADWSSEANKQYGLLDTISKEISILDLQEYIYRKVQKHRLSAAGFAGRRIVDFLGLKYRHFPGGPKVKDIVK